MNRKFFIIVMAIFAMSAIGTTAFADTTFEARVDWNSAPTLHWYDAGVVMSVLIINGDLEVVNDEEMDIITTEDGFSTYSISFDPAGDGETWQVLMNDANGHNMNVTILYPGGYVEEVINTAEDDFVDTD